MKKKFRILFACSRKILAHSDWQAIVNLYIYKYTNIQIYKYKNIYVCMGTTANSEVGTGHSTENSDKSLY